MITVVKAAGATVANGALSFWYQGADGVLADVFAVSVQILNADASTTVLAKTALSTTTNRKGTGHYAAVWDSSAATAGMFTVRWFYKVASTDAEQSFDLPFELVAAAYPFGPHYCTIKSLRDEGLLGPTGGYSDVQAQGLIVRASRYVEHFTGREFEAQYRSVSVDGTSARALLLDEPIVSIEAVTIKDPMGGIATVDDTLRVYNRHLTEGLRSPDDRDSPKLEFIHGNDLGGVNEYPSGLAPRNFLRDLTWPRGRQNVGLIGLFGFTEPDGSFIGGTPWLIQEATRMLVFRNLPKLINTPTGTTAVIMEATRDQQVQYAQPGAGGDTRMRNFTGDPNIDQILVGFMRPPYFGSA